MEETPWNRQVYIPKPGPAPSSGSALIGPAIMLGLITLFVAGGIFYVRTYGLNFPDARPDPQMQLMVARLQEMTARLEELEARLRITPPPSKVPPLPSQLQVAAKPGTTSARSRSKLVPAATPSRAAGETALNLSASAPKDSGDSAALRELQDELTSSREAWEAASNRLGNTIGELGVQRKDLESTQAALGNMQRDLQRSYLPFQLDKRVERQRIGPVWMALRSTDRDSQRFTMRLYFDDRWVEVKDRVLGERVEFYVSNYAQPLELVVSAIAHDEVSGRLAIPQSQDQNH